MQINVGGCEHFSLLCKWSATSFHGPTDAEVTRFINSCPITFQHLFTLPTLSTSLIRCECSFNLFNVFFFYLFFKCMVKDIFFVIQCGLALHNIHTCTYDFFFYKWSNFKNDQENILLFSRGLRRFVIKSHMTLSYIFDSI